MSRGEKWTDSEDTGIVLQSLIDSLTDAQNDNKHLGEIVFGDDWFRFKTPVVFNQHRGVTLTGQSFRQSNGQAGTQFIADPDEFPSGRGILEFGNIGDGSNPGDAEACHVRNIFINLRGNDAAGIYNWGQDRVRLSDVKAVDNGPAGNSIIYIGSWNSNIVNTYADNAAFVTNEVLGKSMNSLRFHNVTFNTTNASTPPLVLSSKGMRITNGLFNGADSPNPMQDGLSIVSGDGSKTAITGSDSRVSDSDLSGALNRIQFTSCRFVTGGNDVKVMENVTSSQFTSCRFSSSGRCIDEFNQTQFAGCLFSGVAKEALVRENGSGSPSAVVGCSFEKFGGNGGEPAINLGGYTHNIAIVGNSFRSNRGSTNDISVSTDAEAVVISGNHLADGIDAPINNAMIGKDRNSIPLVVNNSINPIGFSRSTPSLPSGTGSSNLVRNRNPQGAWIYHDGSGIKINSFGAEHSLPHDPNPVFLPRAGQIWFEDSVPTEWKWWWI